MKKEVRGVHTLKGKTEHREGKTEAKQVSQEGEHRLSELKSILENLEAETQQFNQECRDLLADKGFRAKVSEACERRWSQWRSPSWYPLDDFIQDVLIKFGLGLHKLRDPSKLEQMLGRVVENQLVDEWRRMHAQKRPFLYESLEPEMLDEQIAAMGTSPEDIYIGILVDEYIDYLYHEERVLLGEYFVEGLTQEEMAARRGISPQAISTRLERILRMIRERFL